MDKGILVNKPFCNWVKLTETLSKHAKHAYHHKALQDADILKNVIENPKSRVDILSSSVLQCRIKENKHIFRQIVRAINETRLSITRSQRKPQRRKQPREFFGLNESFFTN